MSISDHINSRINQAASFVVQEDALEIINSGELTSKVRALTLRAIIATPGLPEFLYNTRIIAPYRRQGFSVVGTGAHAVALRDGHSAVRKIYPETAAMNIRQKHEHIDLLRYKQSVAQKHLGRFVLPQSFSIEPHPLHESQSVVSASQPLVVAQGSIRVATAQPHPELDEFTDRSFAMQDEDAALPDVVGNKNLLICKDRRLILVDPITLHARDPDDQNAYARADTALRHYRQ